MIMDWGRFSGMILEGTPGMLLFHLAIVMMLGLRRR